MGRMVAAKEWLEAGARATHKGLGLANGLDQLL